MVKNPELGASRKGKSRDRNSQERGCPDETVARQKEDLGESLVPGCQRTAIHAAGRLGFLKEQLSQATPHSGLT